jgi:hypothetical protein
MTAVTRDEFEHVKSAVTSQQRSTQNQLISSLIWS